MPEWIWHWSGYAVALVAYIGVVWALFRDRSRGLKRCRRCWYDMAGVVDLPADCPECGKPHTKPKHLTRTRRRWGRAGVLSLVMVVGGYGLWVVPRVQDEGATGVVPTTVLLLGAPWYPVPIEPDRYYVSNRYESVDALETVFDEEEAFLARVNQGKPRSQGEIAVYRFGTLPRMRRSPAWLIDRTLDWWRLNGLLAKTEWSSSEEEPVMYRLHELLIEFDAPSRAYTESLVWQQYLEAASTRDAFVRLEAPDDLLDPDTSRFFIPRRTPVIPHPARWVVVWSVDPAGAPFASASGFWAEGPYPLLPQTDEMTRYLQLRDEKNRILRVARVTYRVEGAEAIRKAVEAGEVGEAELLAYPVVVEELELP